jgi:quinoprotein glucose dehydrogenase
VLREGKLIDAVAQVTKTGFTFVFERATGKPLFDIEERPVPPSLIEGEKAHPTQPYPVKPAPFARQSMKREELANLYPEHKAFCEELVKDAVFAPLYTPIGPQRTILFPGTNGGTNWGGASFDPETRTLYVNSMDVAMTFQLVKGREGASLPFRTQGTKAPNSRFWDNNLYPCQQPPWGHLTAINLDTGEFRWRSVLGEYDDLTKRGIAKTGTPNLGGSLVTAGGLLFIAATNDGRFRAFDKDNGRQLWETRLPASGFANPMTYTGKKSKRQFVVIAAGGGNKYSTEFSDALVAFAIE